jgi:hypothetical protein
MTSSTWTVRHYDIWRTVLERASSFYLMKKSAIIGFGALALMNLAACAFDDDEGVTRTTTTTEETSVHTVPSAGVTTQTQTVQPVVY